MYEQREQVFHLVKCLYRFNGRLKSLMKKKKARVFPLASEIVHIALNFDAKVIVKERQ